MSKYGTIVDSSAVRFERTLPGPIERVWAYLTEPEKRGTWLAKGEMELREGGRVELHFRNGELSPGNTRAPEAYRKYENDHKLAGSVIQCDPPRVLSHTWGDTPESSEVTFELFPEGAQVRLVVTHRRLDGAAMQSVSGGWHTHLQILEDRLNERAPRPFWEMFGELDEEYKARLAAK